MILVATLGVALGLGLLSRGSLQILRRLRIKGEVALTALLVLQLLAPFFAPRLGIPKVATLSLWSAILVAAVGICFWNRELRGMWLVAIGLLLNAIVVVANLGMPVDANAFSRWSSSGSLAPAALDHLHVLLGSTTRLSFLADILAFPGPSPIASLVSAGDVLLLVGVAVILTSGVVGEQLSTRAPAARDGGRRVEPDTSSRNSVTEVEVRRAPRSLRE